MVPAAALRFDGMADRWSAGDFLPDLACGKVFDPRQAAGPAVTFAKIYGERFFNSRSLASPAIKISVAQRIQ